MRERLSARLRELREQQRLGVERLQILEREQTQLNTTLFRISGAIQVIEEELTAEQAAAEQAAAEQAAEPSQH
jgi:hypothetical protein